MEAREYRKIARRLIITEERTKLLKGLLSHGVGCKEEEEFIQHEMGKLKGRNVNFKKE